MKKHLLLIICAASLSGIISAEETDSSEKTQFKTAEITTKKNMKQVRAVLKDWGQLAEARLLLAHFSTQIDASQKESAMASAGIISSITDNVKKKSRKIELHVALDAQNKIQAIAITQLSKGCHALKLLATNPENIEIFGYEKAVRGSGTAIIAHLANKILQKKSGCKKLHLFALSSALDFYTKLGFVKDHKKPQLMMLKRQDMKRLVSESEDVVKFSSKEPKLAHL
jgi:azurin